MRPKPQAQDGSEDKATNEVPAAARASSRDDPLVLTISDAAERLQIGRTLAYELAHVFLASGGTTGLPVIRIGRCLRVPRARLEEFVASGAIGGDDHMSPLRDQ